MYMMDLQQQARGGDDIQARGVRWRDVDAKFDEAYSMFHRSEWVGVGGINNDCHRINNDHHSINNDYHSINNDCHRINNDCHRSNNE